MVQFSAFNCYLRGDSILEIISVTKLRKILSFESILEIVSTSNKSAFFLCNDGRYVALVW